MRREKLNEYLGANVEITFIDNHTVRGVLGFTPEFSEHYGYRKPNFYTIGDIVFKCSHVKKLREIKEV